MKHFGNYFRVFQIHEHRTRTDWGVSGWPGTIEIDKNKFKKKHSIVILFSWKITFFFTAEEQVRGRVHPRQQRAIHFHSQAMKIALQNFWSQREFQDSLLQNGYNFWFSFLLQVLSSKMLFFYNFWRKSTHFGRKVLI